MKQRDEGFTLIELLIVIVILGILAAVVVFAVGGITDRGNDSACAADKKTLEVAVEAYYAYRNKYPEDVTSLITNAFDGDTQIGYKLLNSPPTLAGLDENSDVVSATSCVEPTDPQ